MNYSGVRFLTFSYHFRICLHRCLRRCLRFLSNSHLNLFRPSVSYLRDSIRYTLGFCYKCLNQVIKIIPSILQDMYEKFVRTNAVCLIKDGWN